MDIFDKKGIKPMLIAVNEEAIWLEPTLVATVEYKPNDKGSLWQPILRRIRDFIS
ncbi:hypothetical protein [Metaclostridioides mangenotii]|uniref:hypothetical protein n=1 Tax=Metaclostridioides mangenotii TaxID=1540 RepID=UPI000A774814|nr:hypothetical protein [Clostridioides mangenotii]